MIMNMTQKEKFPLTFFKSIGRLVGKWDNRKRKTVYFISGMCYNCKVFDKLTLPRGYRKKYIEWHIPKPDETLTEYAYEMAKNIDTSKPFILIGYSFGAVIMQEIDHFLRPEKSIIISSFKDKSEVPTFFKAIRKVNLVDRVPNSLYTSTEFITNAFNRLFFHASNTEFEEYMTFVDPVYIKWAAKQITNWVPDYKDKHLYHIHGTNDQIFPFDQLKNVFPIEGGDHLMVFKKADVVSSVLSSILLMKE